MLLQYASDQGFGKQCLFLVWPLIRSQADLKTRTARGRGSKPMTKPSVNLRPMCPPTSRPERRFSITRRMTRRLSRTQARHLRHSIEGRVIGLHVDPACPTPRAAPWASSVSKESVEGVTAAQCCQTLGRVESISRSLAGSRGSQSFARKPAWKTYRYPEPVGGRFRNNPKIRPERFSPSARTTFSR